MQFIRLISDGPCSAFFNMALDEAVTEAVCRGISPPTLRLYQWNRPSLSIGYFQKISDIDTDYCCRSNYPVVRRMTGGRAVLHDSELTYSFSALSGSYPFDNNLLNNYTVISSALVSGLRLNGIEAKSSFRRKKTGSTKNPACFRAVSYGEITVNGKKVIGSAQKRFGNGFLQHGSILIDFNAENLCRVLKHRQEGNFPEIGSLKEYSPEVSLLKLKRCLRASFEKALNVRAVLDEPNRFELDLARKLENDKYSSPEWNFRR